MFGWRMRAAFLVLLFTNVAATADESLGLRAPDGFEVSLYADDALAHNIYSMTIDSLGRVVVAGPGYVKILIDGDEDGRAESFKLFSDKPASGAHGMCFDGRDLIATGDNAIARFEDANGDDQADGPPQVWTNLRNPEHGANGIVRGPDGWFYLICGNDAGVNDTHAGTPSSPIRSPRCGALVRFSPDGQTSEVVAHGYRNPYDCDFNAWGNVFTTDSDNEREHALPWYTPTRVFDIAQGMEHGWLELGWQRSWNRPEWFSDNVERLTEIGRGSPTGLVVYRHRRFPERYQGGLFTACWMLGRVYHVPLARRGATYRGQHEVFLETTGDVGFAPVDLAIGSDGDMFIAVGGRGTRGGVFRVRHAEASAGDATADAPSELERVLAADQPLASWSRAVWSPLAKTLREEAFERAIADAALPVELQARGVEVLVEVFGGVKVAAARKAVALNRPELTARVAWALARGERSPGARALLANLTYERDPRVARAAWEGIAAWGDFDEGQTRRPPNWSAALSSASRRVRAAAMMAARGSAGASYARYRDEVDVATTSERERLASLWIAFGTSQAQSPSMTAIEMCLDVLAGEAPAESRLEAARLIEVALGDLPLDANQPELYAGYILGDVDRLPDEDRVALANRLAAMFPAGDERVDRELARLLAALEVDVEGLAERVMAKIDDSSDFADDLHYLIALSRLPASRSASLTDAIAHALVMVPRKMAAASQFPDRNWPLRVSELFDRLCQANQRLAMAVATDEQFGLPAHCVFASQMPIDARRAAARRLLQMVANAEPGEGWTPELVTIVGSLDDAEALPILREQWSDYGLRDAIAAVLADRAAPDDRQRLFEALASLDRGVVTKAARALASQAAVGSPDEIASAIRALRLATNVPEDRATREALVALLEQLAERRFGIVEPKGGKPRADAVIAAHQAWFDWFAATHPEAAKQLAGFSGQGADEWRSRLAQVDWPQGDVERGKQVFERRACHRCHVGGGKLGPSLAGAAARFARDDLFAAIVDPNKDVAPLYQTRLIATRGGQIHIGLPVYESADGTLLQTGPDTTIRVTGDEVLMTRPSAQSIMPQGLLNDATDADLADLYAYLRTIQSD